MKLSINSNLLQISIILIFQLFHCHARMKEILSYLNIPKTTSMCYMYEADYSD